MLGSAARADRPHCRALGDGRAPGERERAEVEERDGVAARGPDGDGEPAAGNGPREGDRPRRRSANRCAGGTADVDSSMLAARVRVVAEGKGS